MHFQNGIGYLSGMKTTLLFLCVFLSASLFGQYTQIPDADFEQWLFDYGHDNVIDGQVLTNNINWIEELTMLPGQLAYEISDLTGIEDFVSLKSLAIPDNNLTSIDVSQNTALESLNCGGNQLTSLDVSQNTALTYLNCAQNQITSLDLTSNTALTTLVCSLNPMTSLDLSTNSALEVFWCNGMVNPATFEYTLLSLDLSGAYALWWVNISGNPLLNCVNIANGNNNNFIDFNSYDCPNLFCIEVDDSDSPFIMGWDIDLHTSFSEDCNNDCTANITELTTSKNLIQILDLMGRETSFKPNIPLIYVYDDGSIEKVFSVEY